MHLILKLPGDHTGIQNSDGSFSLELWKRDINRLRSVDLKTYVNDGTLIGAELVNEPHAPGKWGGKIIGKEQLEGAAAYAKSIWPYLPVGAGRSDYLAMHAPWEHLDFGHSQYHMRKGDVGSWLRATDQESRKAGVALLLSLNFYKGEPDNAPLSPQELRSLGTALASDTNACALTGYIYAADYFARPGIAEAFSAIADVAAANTAQPCYITAVKP